MKIADWVAGQSGKKDASGKLLPGETYEFRRDGRRQELGGGGTVWICGCPDGNAYPVHLCRHMKKFIEASAEAKRAGVVNVDQLLAFMPRQMVFTAHGRRAAASCTCIKRSKPAVERHPRSWLRPKAPEPQVERHPRSWLRPKA